MPCDAVVLNRVDLPKTNEALRIKALQALGARLLRADGTSFSYQGQTYTIINGQLVGPDVSVADKLKRAYSAEVLKYSAKRAGWGLRQTGEFEYQVIKS